MREVSAHLADFEDTAALLANLDLLVSVDTSVVHLAGALGVACWVLGAGAAARGLAVAARAGGVAVVSVVAAVPPGAAPGVERVVVPA